MHHFVARTFKSLIGSFRWLTACWFLLGIGFVYAQSRNEQAAQETAHKRWAMIIGIDTYDRSFAELEYSDDDARNVRDALIDSGAYSKDNVILMTPGSEKTDRPTKNNIMASLNFLKRNVSKNDEVFFYFSGHGFNKDSTNYLVTSDAVPNLPSTTLSEEEILGLLRGIGVDRRFVVFDACRNQLRTGAMSTGNSSWEDKKYTDTKGMFILYSTSENEFSWQEKEVNGEKIRSSMFTHYLVKGLKGRDGIDGITGDESDGVVSGGELLKYTSKKLSEYDKLTGNKQTPRKGGELSSGLFRVITLAQSEAQRPIRLMDRNLSASSSTIIKNDLICEIEQSLTREFTKDETVRLGSPQEYISSATSEGIKKLSKLVKKHNKHQEHRGMTYVMGVAGSGKSHLAKYLHTSCVLRLKTLFDHKDVVSSLDVIDYDDLKTLDGRMIFNKLAGIKKPKSFDTENLLFLAREANKNKDIKCFVDNHLVPFVVIDDLDEIHPETATELLKVVASLATGSTASPNRFLHFIVLGRPEAFQAWLRSPKRPRVAQIWPMRLRGLNLQTMGDLKWWAKNSMSYVNHPHEPSEEQVVQFRNTVLKNPFLSYSILIPAHANYLSEQIWAGESLKPEKLRHNLFQNLLQRNYDTHKRPARNRGLFPKLYERLLMKVAIKYLKEDEDGKTKIKSNGFFRVNPKDRVEVKDPITGLKNEVSVSALLDRSGLIDMNPTGFASSYYRFEPFWLHAHLVELWNQDQSEGYKYRTCM